MNNPAIDEDFLEFESKVNQVMKLLDDINNANKKEGEEGATKKPVKNILDEINENDFIITVKEDRTSINKTSAANINQVNKNDDGEMDKFTFMKQIEQDAEERAKNKRERERIAQNFRRLKNYKRAIMDCDYVLNKLEEKNLRSWLYRAAAYKRCGDEKNYETSIKLARKNNPKKTDFIDDFLDKFARESI
ncbi:uncharacterized protein ACRADG_000429 isoform 2-T2 [Cochliomyia hominivorax]